MSEQPVWSEYWDRLNWTRLATDTVDVLPPADRAAFRALVAGLTEAQARIVAALITDAASEARDDGARTAEKLWHETLDRLPDLKPIVEAAYERHLEELPPAS